MSAIDSVLKRFGFIKLSRYGLVLTPEGRIMSLRPAVLDDGLGSRIVGWADGDLAAMDLEKWEPARPAPQRAMASRVAMPAMPKPAVVIAPAAPAVAPAPQVEEDEWEWEIALAHARAAAEDEKAVAPAVRRARLDTIPPPSPTLVVKSEPMPDWPKTQPITLVEEPAPKKPQPLAAVAPRAGTTPPTVIPVPKLPSIKDRMAQIQPVVSKPQARTRFAKGTGPVTGTHPPRRASTDDVTRVDLPAVARTVALPALPSLPSRR